MTALAGEVYTNDVRTQNRVPRFCSVCGSRLVPNSEITGYDPYSGEPVEDQSLKCNNPTVNTRLGKRSVTHHPQWTNFDGAWSQA